MDVETEPAAGNASGVSYRGILITMGLIVTTGAAAGLIFAGTMFSIGVVFGGLLALGNYWWLDRVTRAIFRPEAVRSAGLLAARYIFRYFALGGVLLLIYLTGAFPMPAVILGLSAFAIAVVIEGLKNIFKSN